MSENKQSHLPQLLELEMMGRTDRLKRFRWYGLFVLRHDETTIPRHEYHPRFAVASPSTVLSKTVEESERLSTVLIKLGPIHREVMYSASV